MNRRRALWSVAASSTVAAAVAGGVLGRGPGLPAANSNPADSPPPASSPDPFAAARPATGPATRPADARPADTRPGGADTVSVGTHAIPIRPYSPDYQVLLRRSLFARPSAVAAAALAAAQMAAARERGAGGGEDAMLAFRGVGLSDGQYTAFIEDPSGKILLVRAGDAVGRGRVVGMTLDDLTYEAGGQVAHVPPGHTLAGTPAPPPRPPATAPAGPPDGQPGGPPQPGQPGGPEAMPPDGMQNLPPEVRMQMELQMRKLKARGRPSPGAG